MSQLAQQPPGGFAGPSDALAAVQAGLMFLARADAAALPAAELAQCLRGLEGCASAHTAASAGMLTAFTARRGYEDDGHGGARPWLIWQARITRGAANARIGWSKRLEAHPAVAAALAAMRISASWARQVCEWTGQLPAGHRGAADQILLAAAAGGADLADLAGLAEEIARRCAQPDADGDDGFTRRRVTLDTHFQGAGKLDGSLTPECAAAVKAVLESLGKRMGPEDDRSRGQRQHDALEEACRRLIAAGGLPDVAGQPVQVQLHMTLDQLQRLPGAAGAVRDWSAGLGPADPASTPGGAGGAAPGGDASGPPAGPRPGDAKPGDDGTGRGARPGGGTTPAPAGHTGPGADEARRAFDAGRAGAGGQPGWIRDPGAAAAYACDAQLAPMVTGTLDPAVLAAMTRDLVTAFRLDPGNSEIAALPRRVRRALRDTVLRHALAALSGPGGLASCLRTSLLPGQLATISLPLDAGTATSTIPPWLRRAVIRRDRHCAFPGCHQPPAACQVHHLRPRSEGGPTALDNLGLLCAFHHLIAVHRWGWVLALNGDGTTTATSPDGTRVLHSHGPPGVPAA